MIDVRKAYDEVHPLIYNFNKRLLKNWLEKPENLAILGHFVNLYN
jgi:hypothetical protein